MKTLLIGSVFALLTLPVLAAQPTCPVDCQNLIDTAVSELNPATDSCLFSHGTLGVLTLTTSISNITVESGGGKADVNVPVCRTPQKAATGPSTPADGAACMAYFFGKCRDGGITVSNY